MMRHLKVAPDGGSKPAPGDDHAEAIVTAPPECEQTLHPLTRAPQSIGWRAARSIPTASAKHTLRALARRWFALSVEITTTVTWVDSPPSRRRCVRALASVPTPPPRCCHLWDNPDRIHCEAAFAKLCGACPIPASSGMTTGRHRLYRGGHRQANAALHRAVIVRMRYHSPTLNDVERRSAEGRPKREIIRCLKRVLAREIFQRVMADYRARQAADLAA